MVTDEEIREQLRQFTSAPIVTMVAEVKSVDEQNGLCVLTDGVVDYYNVRLQAIKAEPNGFCLIPKVGSMAIAVKIEDTSSMMIINAIEYTKVIMRGGKNGGLVNVVDLVSKLNAIERDVNNLKNALSTWVPVPQDGGAALKTVCTSWAGSALTETTRDDLEDKNIIH